MRAIEALAQADMTSVIGNDDAALRFTKTTAKTTVKTV
ncbi:hypothetical protein EL18_02790 [Nitratireductor basaltis]|jgi:hypothetical protein|uniref:Uncharacterized protein n=1 Tax=Nitratireductor basaltis TaxID=472175 RepID=A0A084U6F2_9HYPH|nr:hypothetical protein EL18_02790 [Nitratireductor basaltis]